MLLLMNFRVKYLHTYIKAYYFILFLILICFLISLNYIKTYSIIQYIFTKHN